MRKTKTRLEFTVGPGGWLRADVRAPGKLESYVAVRFARDAEGEWGPDGTLFVYPPTQEKLRTIPLRRIVLAVRANEGLRERLAAKLDQVTPEAGSADFWKALTGFPQPELPPIERPAGRKLSDEFYATVAERYRDAAARGLNPRTAIADAASVSTDVAGRWVREARKRAFLPPTQPGKVGV